jgi:hypothetical protein
LRAFSSKKNAFRQLLRQRLPKMGGERQHRAERAHPHAHARYRAVGIVVDDDDRAQALAARQNGLVFEKKP